MNWEISEAQQKFSELINATTTEEPQLIYNEEQLVVAVIKAEMFQEFMAWRQQQKSSLANAFKELRQLCIEEDYILEVAPRQDRPNTFTETVDDLSL